MAKLDEDDMGTYLVIEVVLAPAGHLLRLDRLSELARTVSGG